MKVSEIQIGDYVNYRGQIIKVTSLYDKGGSNEVGWSDKESVWVNADNVEPIPLTPEILEKNGFVTNDEQGNWKGYRIYSLFNTNKSCIFMLKLYEKDSIVEISLDMSPYYIVFKFVHQLQHALRLCGIEKEIIL